jgi:hypothetical protein
MKMLRRTEHAGDRVDVVGGAAVVGSQMIVHSRVERVELRDSVTMSRISRNLSLSLRTNSLMRS